MKKLYEESNIQNIAEAIRNKLSSTDTYKVSEMADKILEIEGGSSPTEITIEKLTPTMTADDYGECEVTASDWSTGASAYKPYRLFDGDISNDGWAINSPSFPVWAQVKLPTSKVIKIVLFYNSTSSGGTEGANEFEIQGSNDGEDYTTLYSGKSESSDGKEVIFINSNESWQYLRLYIISNKGSSWVTTRELEYYGY